MFSTREVGRKIRRYRNQKNMTQLELADCMGVSYQAVSNWERGNSMPDISKLGELSERIGCSLDELLGNSKETETIKKVIGKEEEEMAGELKSTEEISRIAPLLQPRNLERIVEEREKIEKDENSEKEINLKELVPLAPFLSEEYMSALIHRIELNGEIKDIVPLAPFLDDETLNYLAEMIPPENLGELVYLAPFLSEKTLDSAVTRAIDEEKIEECTGLYPFLSGDALNKIADYLVKRGGLSALSGIAPFLG